MYAVSTIGLALVYGSLNMLNMSHGALLALGGYVCLYAMTALGLPAVLAVPAAMAVCGVVGLLIYHLAARPMLASRSFETRIFIATIGIGAVLENVIMRSFGPQPVAQPLNLPGRSPSAPCTCPNQNILILAVAVLMMAVRRRAAQQHAHGPRHPRHGAEPRCGAADGHPHRQRLCAGAGDLGRARRRLGHHDLLALGPSAQHGRRSDAEGLHHLRGRGPWQRLWRGRRGARAGAARSHHPISLRRAVQLRHPAADRHRGADLAAGRPVRQTQVVRL
jgi:hypothetical protein